MRFPWCSLPYLTRSVLFLVEIAVDRGFFMRLAFKSFASRRLSVYGPTLKPSASTIWSYEKWCEGWEGERSGSSCCTLICCGLPSRVDCLLVLRRLGEPVSSRFRSQVLAVLVGILISLRRQIWPKDVVFFFRSKALKKRVRFNSIIFMSLTSWGSMWGAHNCKWNEQGFLVRIRNVADFGGLARARWIKHITVQLRTETPESVCGTLIGWR